MIKSFFNRPVRKVVLMLGVLWAIAPAPAWADLTIMPLRIIFGDRDRSAELTLANTSTTTNTYRLEWLNNRMNEDGSYTAQGEPLNPVFDPAKALVVSPRQVTIPPGQQQRIRVSLRRPADLPEGEYRAHLVMRKVDQQAPAMRRDAEGMVAYVNVNVGFSIPVVVRQGLIDAHATLSDISLTPPTARDPAHLSVYIDRQGKHSLSGRLRVFWTPPGGKEEQVGILNNINVFHEISRRSVRVPLTASRPITGGTMRVIFEDMEGKNNILAQQELPLR